MLGFAPDTFGLRDVRCNKPRGMSDDFAKSGKFNPSTPQSQMSTAPNTPLAFMLSDPGDAGHLRSLSGLESPLDKCDEESDADEAFGCMAGLMSSTTTHEFESQGKMKPCLLNSELGQWAESQVRSDECFDKSQGPTMPPLLSELAIRSEAEVTNCMDVGPVALSELGQWAEKSVKAEEWVPNRLPPTLEPLCSELGRRIEIELMAEDNAGFVGSRLLNSELGQWAEKQVTSDECFDKLLGPTMPPGLCVLKSELGRWAEKQVRSD